MRSRAALLLVFLGVWLNPRSGSAAPDVPNRTGEATTIDRGVAQRGNDDKELDDAINPKTEKYRRFVALVHAAARGDVRTVQTLVRRGVDVNGRDAGDGFAPINRPIVWASAKGHLSVVNVLLDAGADPNWCSGSCVTALHEAIRGRHAAVVARLLKAGARPDIDYDGQQTTLQLATQTGDKRIIRLVEQRLSAAGANGAGTEVDPIENTLAMVTGLRSIVHKKSGFVVRLLEADGSASVAEDPIALFLVVTNDETPDSQEHVWRLPHGVDRVRRLSPTASGVDASVEVDGPDEPTPANQNPKRVPRVFHLCFLSADRKLLSKLLFSVDTKGAG